MLSDGLIGALIGGGATVIVSAMTQIIVIRNLNKQHAHDAKQKAEDRKAAMRREVYLRFIEDFGAMHSFLWDLQLLPLSSENRLPFQNFINSSRKVQLISEKPISELARQQMEQVINAFHGLVFESGEVRLAVARMKEVEGRLEAAKADTLTADVLLKRAMSDRASEVEKATLVTAYEVKRKWQAEMQKEFEQASNEADPLQNDYAIKASKQMNATAKLFDELVLMLRAEIGVEHSTTKLNQLPKV